MTMKSGFEILFMTFVCTSFVIVVTKDVSEKEKYRSVGRIRRESDEHVVSRVKRGRGDDRNKLVPPPFGLFPGWKPPTKPPVGSRTFPFPSRPGNSTTRSPTTKKLLTPPTPKRPPIPTNSTKIISTAEKLTSPSTTTERSSTVITTQTAKPSLPSTAQTTLRTTTEAKTTMKESTVAITTPTPTTTSQKGLKMDNCFENNGSAQYDLTANTHTGPSVLVVRPKPSSEGLKMYFTYCQVRLLSIEEWSLMTFRAPYSRSSNRCNFSLKTLLPQTEFFVRVRMEAMKGFVMQHKMFKWSATYRGFKTGDYVPETEMTQSTTRIYTTTTTTQPTIRTTPSLPPECQDYNTIKCPDFANRGECTYNQEFMAKNCRRSCPQLCLNELLIQAAKLDSSICVDIETKKCSHWGHTLGYCGSTKLGDRALMRDYCRKTCGLCNVPVVDKSSHEECRDKNPFQCSAWTQNNQCEKNPEFLYRYCPKSCNKCIY